MLINPKIPRISLGLLSSILLPTNLVLAQAQFPPLINDYGISKKGT
jgi:hypothetical protein